MEILIVWILCVLFAGQTLAISSNGENTYSRREREIIDEILNNSTYDARVRPASITNRTAVDVNATIVVRSIQEVDDVNMNYKMEVTFILYWVDKRLEFTHLLKNRSDGFDKMPYVYLTAGDRDVWKPATTFSNEIGGHRDSLLGPNAYCMIFPSGELKCRNHVSLSVSCTMDLRRFPFDEQICSLNMRNYLSYTTEDIFFGWKSLDNPVYVQPGIHLNKFSLEHYCADAYYDYCCTGLYNYLRVTFLFKREFTYYLMKFLIPMLVLVMVAYLSLWIGNSGTIVSLTTVIVMALGTMTTAESRGVVVTALDVWMGCCLSFAFGAFLLCVFSNFLEGKHKRSMGSDIEAEEVELLMKSKGFEQKSRRIQLEKKGLFFAKIAYLISFFLFVVVYGLVYWPVKTAHPDLRLTESENPPAYCQSYTP